MAFSVRYGGEGCCSSVMEIPVLVDNGSHSA
jgi:hypothetical protein